MSPADPKVMLEQAKDLRAKADALEARAIREALRRCDWFEKPAAEQLDIPLSSLKSLLLPGRRHADVGEEAARERGKAGYRGGNPHRDALK
jgi:hypothetical protein